MSRPLELRSQLTATPFEGHSGLSACGPDWEALNAGSGRDPLCNRFDWVEAYAHAWVADQDLFGWRLADDQGPVGVLAFRKEERLGRFALGRARLLQDGSFDSDYLDPPVRSGSEAAVAEVLFDLLARRAGIQAAVLSPIERGSPLLAELRQVAAKRHLSPREEALVCPATRLPDSFEGFLGGLKKRMRSKVRQALRRVEERGGSFAWCDDPLRMDADLEDLYRLHAARWADAGIPGAFAEQRRRAFYRRLVDQHLPAGRLRFSRLELGGETVACQFGIAVGGRYYQLQEGYAPPFEELRVGVALRAWTIERLIEQGHRAYDFMAGESRHKSDWGGVDRPCVTLACAVPKSLGRLAYAARRVRDQLRSGADPAGS